MTKRGKLFVVIYASVAILASISILFNVVSNLEHHFITVMEKNSLTFQNKVVKVNDVLESVGKTGNFLINLEDLPEEFEESIHADMAKYLVYDESRDFFHLDNIQNSNFDITKINNITGRGNLDFLKDKHSVKSLELYFMFFMNKELYWLNERLVSSDWIYYTSLNNMTSIRSRNDEYVTSDEFQFMEDMLNMSFVTDGTKENLENRNEVYWSSPYIDLAGKGLMITASYPIDYDDEYIGSLSVDFISNTLNGILDENYTTALVDKNGTILATNAKNIDISSELKSFNELSAGVTYDEIKDIAHNKVVKINGIRVAAHKLDGSPYTLYQVYPKSQYILDATIDFFPVILIFVFFGITSLTLRKVRVSESKLKETLSELQIKQEELDYISKYDPLTNIYNRRGMYSELKSLEAVGQLIGSSLVLFDIDHFKLVNDTYGHDVGDEVLSELCLVVNKYIGENEIFARYGGEEFILISKATDLENTCAIAETIRAGIESHSFKTIESLTVSLGVSTFRSKDTNETWIANADAALYKAKKDGRNKVYYYENYDFICYTDKNMRDL